MCEEKSLMRCPHCGNVGPCVWVGFGKDWVLCQYCQRRVRWSEVQANYLVSEEDDSKPTPPKVGAYH